MFTAAALSSTPKGHSQSIHDFPPMQYVAIFEVDTI